MAGCVSTNAFTRIGFSQSLRPRGWQFAPGNCRSAAGHFYLGNDPASLSSGQGEAAESDSSSEGSSSENDRRLSGHFRLPEDPGIHSRRLHLYSSCGCDADPRDGVASHGGCDRCPKGKYFACLPWRGGRSCSLLSTGRRSARCSSENQPRVGILWPSSHEGSRNHTNGVQSLASGVAVFPIPDLPCCQAARLAREGGSCASASEAEHSC